MIDLANKSQFLKLRFPDFLMQMIASSLFILILSSCTGNIKNTESLQLFQNRMVATHHFDPKELSTLFDAVQVKEEIINRISKPAEGLPWYKYRKIFLTEARIDEGVKFWQQNEKILSNVAHQYGVPSEIIVAILGVETSYGKHTGKHRVIDALATLAFEYPPRTKFFQDELENFLLLCREERINPLTPTGSYAGAMGVPQFMPSSYRAYATDFDQDQHRDIWQNTSDVIASVSHYFVKHGWQKNQPVAFVVQDKTSQNALNYDSLKPNLRIAGLQSNLNEISRALPLDTKVKLLLLKQEYDDELWMTLENFYVITRYNHSPLYAMAVYQLSQAITKRKNSS